MLRVVRSGKGRGGSRGGIFGLGWLVLGGLMLEVWLSRLMGLGRGMLLGKLGRSGLRGESLRNEACSFLWILGSSSWCLPEKIVGLIYGSGPLVAWIFGWRCRDSYQSPNIQILEYTFS